MLDFVLGLLTSLCYYRIILAVIEGKCRSNNILFDHINIEDCSPIFCQTEFFTISESTESGHKFCIKGFVLIIQK